MSINLMSSIFKTDFRDLQDEEGNTTKASTAKFVCIALADHANDEGEGAYPSIETIAYKTNLSRTAVINALDALKHNGVLLANGLSKHQTINYTVNPGSFSQGGQRGVLVNLVDSPSQPALPPPVNPVDPNHPLTTQETYTDSQSENGKPDLLDGIIHYQLKPKSIKDAFAKHFKLTPNWEAKYNRQFLEWLVEVKATAEQVEHAAKLWGKDKRFNWTVPTLKGIQEHWLELVAVEEDAYTAALRANGYDV